MRFKMPQLLPENAGSNRKSGAGAANRLSGLPLLYIKKRWNMPGAAHLFETRVLIQVA
jgi:hypothetical protein